MLMLNLFEVPFSRRGSFFAISYDRKTKKLWLRDVRGGDESPSQLYELEIRFNEQVVDLYGEAAKTDFELVVTPTSFSFKHQSGEHYLEMIFPRENQVRIKQKGMGLALVADKVRYDSLNPISNKSFEYISYKKECKYQIDFKNERFDVDAPWEKVGNSHIIFTLPEEGRQEVIFTDYKVVPPIHEPFSMTFEAEKQVILEEFMSWTQVNQQTTPYEASNQLANYILWSSIVREEGLLLGESIYMSKNWMQNIWSWDNCFNAFGVEEKDPELAYNQMKIFVEYQDESGAYPDFINTQFASYNCVKPPIHAWAYEKLMEKNAYFTDENRLKEMYKSISHSTRFWLNYRREGEKGLCYYTHGNDSGWDNASIFHEGLAVIAPDLQGYLIQQMDTLARWARKLNRVSDAVFWEGESEQFYQLLLTELYDEKKEQFVAKSLRTGQVIDYLDSLILRLPLVIAYRLPEKITNKITRDLETMFEGDFGLSTEAKLSTVYKNNGYWLGPIWAPSSYIFVDALLRSGKETMGLRLAQKYCEMTLIGGMAENYNPETGKGNDDLSFTWTSSVFLKMQELVLTHRKRE